MKRRELLASMATLSSIGALGLLPGCASQVFRGTGDLGVVIGRANGTLYLVDTTAQALIGEVPGLGDLSHASVVFSRDGLFAYVFGRDGGLTQVNLLECRIARRIMQAGNSIGGAISADGTLVAAQNYTPGGVKVFDARTLELLADIPAEYAPGKLSRVVGLVDLPGRRFAYSLFDGNAIWVTDCSDPRHPRTTKFENIGRQPYDALVTPNGRHYIAGLFGEDGLARMDLWAAEPQVERILGGYGRGQEPLPVYKMPHLRGWAVAGRRAYLPAIGRHEVLVVDTETWAEVGRIPVAGQPVFVMARPDGRQVWVNFSVPDYHRVQVIDTQSQQIVQTLEPGKAVLHMEFTPRGEAVWISSRDDNRVSIIDTQSFATRARLDVPAPSGIFFTARAARVGF
ncbi:MAG: cytochrome D1 domain-containing protein [Hydrogenophaga sp.]|uniref:cytochrome D1 domain-containing protein n=1 Tax=Hydrogenophaga sp. TaxID=1904254 RepID=UPI00272F70DD|nr:cytochrome D1 domain-containing protein [Hydrogenophaga sp.]MDP2405452.1 cytochrome D1 domain-containing protein [Hydrogenophaga sp.]MDZ4177165.1 cytochrome D1 domain-containing protein [Hydrogenophaga sp.]